MSNLNKIKEEGEKLFKQQFLKVKICKCCLLEECDYSTTGCPWYQDSLILNKEGQEVDTVNQILNWHNKQMDKACSLAIDEVEEIADSIEEYIAVEDQDGHRYQIPKSKKQEWRDFLDIPYEDEKSWDVPDFAERIDGQDVKSYKDSLKQKLLSLKNKNNG